MLSVLSITSPIFLIIALGYVAVKSAIISQDGIRAMGAFVLYFTLPALIFKSLSSYHYSDIIEPHFLLAYGLGSVVTITLGFIVSRKVFANTLTISAAKATGMTMPNSAFIGYPVLLQLFHEPPAAAFAMALMIENLVIMPIVLILLELGSSHEKGHGARDVLRQILLRIVKNPILIAIASGLIVSLLGIKMPPVLNMSFDILSRSTAAVALFVIGGILCGASLRGNRKDIATIVTGKLFLHPAMVALFVFLLPDFDNRLQMSAIVFAAMPAASIYPILVGRYGYQQTASSAQMGGTVLSFVSIAMVILILQGTW